MRVWAKSVTAGLMCGAIAGAPDGGVSGAVAATVEAPHKYVHCDFEYTIQPGDTLASISETAYGTSHQQLIFARNWNRIDMLGTLPVGEVIIVPCAVGDSDYTPDEEELEDAMLSTEWASAPALTSSDANRAAEAFAEGTLRLLTADGQAPYVDGMLRNGGFIAEIIGRALDAGAADQPTETVFVNERDAHLTDLLADGSFDIGFPWLRPPCEAGAELSTLSVQSAQLCETFVFSEPVFEAVSGFFVRTQDAVDLAGYDAFVGQRLCAPEGDSLVALAVKGLTEESMSIIRSTTPASCIGMLIVGEVDIVVADSNDGARAIAAFGAAGRVSERTDLSLLKTLHAVAHTSKPNAVAALGRLNDGLREIRADGRWFQVVGRFLAEQ